MILTDVKVNAEDRPTAQQYVYLQVCAPICGFLLAENCPEQAVGTSGLCLIRTIFERLIKPYLATLIFVTCWINWEGGPICMDHMCHFAKQMCSLWAIACCYFVMWFIHFTCTNNSIQSGNEKISLSDA